MKLSHFTGPEWWLLWFIGGTVGAVKLKMLGLL